MNRRAPLLCCGMIALLLLATKAQAAGWRVFGESSLRYVELRQLELVEIPLGQAAGTGSLRRLPDGRFVECDEGDSTCTLYQSGDGGSVAPMLHDVRVSAWMRGGWSLAAHGRARSINAGNGELWPRAEDEFDLLGAYLDYRRYALSVRAGRQWRSNALGYANFDGLSARYSWQQWSGQAYAGYSLLRTVNEAVDGDALLALEELAPNEPGRLFGGNANYVYRGRYRVAGAYERELRDDRKGFYSERAALDGQALLARWELNARWQRDLASDRNNELSLGTTTPRWQELAATVQWRRHRPYFASWTIWNAFAPVGFDEFSARTDWLSTRWPLSIGVSAAQREYGEPSVGLQFAPLREDGWNAGIETRYAPSLRWELAGNYRRDIGLGEARSQGLLQLRYRHRRGSLALFGSGFDYVREYRISGRTVFGAGLQGEVKLGYDTAVFGSIAHYAHDAQLGPNFDQTRGQLGLRWQLGRDPGLREAGR